MDERLSEHFKRSEFSCNGGDCCGGTASVNPILVEKLEALRETIGPIKINSGFRCLTYNRSKKVGSYDGSQHPKGNAADIASDGRDIHDMGKMAEAAGFYVIKYPWGLHLDVR